MKPAISILMPVRDGEPFLAAALRSIRGQRLREWELLAVNDGSTDRTLEILKRAGKRDERIRTFTIPPTGHVEALRSAASEARAPLLARMDVDDIMNPNRLLMQLARMDSPPRVDVLATRVRLFGKTGEGMRRYVRWQNSLVDHDEIVRNLFVESPIAHPSVLMRRNIFERAGGYRDPGWAEDFDLWHRMRERGAKFGRLPRKLLSWRDRPDRLTRTDDRYSTGRFHECRLHYFLRDPLSRGPVTVWGAGPIGRRWAQDLLAAGCDIPCAIDIDPRKVGRRIADNRVRVVDIGEGLARREGLILGAVGARGARDLIRKRLLEDGRIEGRDFLFVA